MAQGSYVHGYSRREAARLKDQADTLVNLLHRGTKYPEGSLVLESGCGTGSQTVTLAANSPDAHFQCIDLSEDSLRAAAEIAAKRGLKNVSFRKADIFSLPFEEESFDHIFVCFVLEHIPDPASALKRLKKVLKKGGSITVIEGDHGSAYFYPQSAEAEMAIRCQISLQAAMGGNSMIGREVYPLLAGAGFRRIKVRPRMVYVDGSLPHLADGFTKKTFTAMIEGVREQALAQGLIDEASWDKGIRDLYRSAEPDGIFCYTFFKGTALK